MNWTLNIRDYSGPLDMLLHMVGKAKIDIKDIFVSEITDQYIRHIQQMEALDMDDASSFIQMAATLLEIKSRSLLPKPPEPQEEDPETLLIRQLEEYAVFKQIAADMQGFEKATALMYKKLPEEYPLPPPSIEIHGLTLEGLMEAFAAVMARAPRLEPQETQLTAQRILRDQHSVPECMLDIVKRVRKGSLPFANLFPLMPHREQVITYFLALLELLRLGRVRVSQDAHYGDILLSRVVKREVKHDPATAAHH